MIDREQAASSVSVTVGSLDGWLDGAVRDPAGLRRGLAGKLGAATAYRRTVVLSLAARARRDDFACQPGKGYSRAGRALAMTDLVAHLKDRPRAGVYVMPVGETTRLAVLDLDDHDGAAGWPAMRDTARRLRAALSSSGFAPWLCRSSGGAGVHVWTMFTDPGPAAQVRVTLARIVHGCGLKVGNGGVGKGEVEIFPKADRVEPGGYRALVALPLAGRSVPLDEAGDPVELTDDVAAGLPLPVPCNPTLDTGEPTRLTKRPANAVLRLPPPPFDLAKLTSAVRWLAERGDVEHDGKRLGFVGRDAWWAVTAILAHAARGQPQHADAICELWEDASEAAATRHGGSYDRRRTIASGRTRSTGRRRAPATP